MQYKNTHNNNNNNQVNQHNNNHRYHPPQYSQNNNCKTVAANSISTHDTIPSNYNDPNNKNTCANYNSSQRTPSSTGPNQLPAAIAPTAASTGTMMMTKQKTSLSDRLNIGDEVRELKLGCTFNTKNTTTAFHTIKYDFKPASVDKSRVATVDVGSNSQVTVTVPNLESSGVPHTVYKGNQRKYTKECLIIYDRKTGDITLEKLSHNIQVKKTRSEVINKPTVVPMQAAGISSSNSNSAPQSKLENSTMRISSKTKVSTGSRRNNIIDFKPRNSPMQGSPSSGTTNHRSPQSAPAWNANNAQATLPSIPMITDEYEPPMGPDVGAYNYNSNSANLSTSSASSNSSHNNSGQEYQFQPHLLKDKEVHQQTNQKRNQHHLRHSPVHTQQQQQQQPQLPQLHNDQNQHAQQHNRFYANGSSNTYTSHGTSINNTAGLGGSSNNNHSVLNMSHNLSNQNLDYNSGMESPHDIASESLAMAAAALEQQIGVLSSSSSSSESDSSASESGSDSDDSTEEDSATAHSQHKHHQHHPKQQHETSSQQHHYKNNMNQLPNLGLGMSQSPSPPPPSTAYPHLQDRTNFTTNGAYPDLLHNDLQLSNSSDDDD